MPIDRLLNATRDIITAAQFCTLITQDRAGLPHARMIDAFAPDADLCIWIGTHPQTRKIAHLAQNNRATLTYMHGESGAYVTLYTRAEVVNDNDTRLKYWKPEWWDFYLGGPVGKNYTLIACRPYRVELISHAHDIGADPTAFKPAALDLTADGWQLDDSLGIPPDDAP